jgi:phosphatidyl-myo-inositol alpha-mannosyltransferase
MKIGLVSPYDFAVPGGVNSHIQHLAENFERLDHEVRIVAPCSRPRSPALGKNVVCIGRPIAVPAGGSMARVALSLRLAPQVKRVLADEKFDVVHIHEPFAAFLPVQFLRFSEAVNVATFHAAREGGGSRWYAYGQRVLRRWFRNLDGKIAVSVPAMRMVSRYFPGYYNIIPNGVDVDHFSARVEPLPQYCDDKLNILFVGRLEKRKGVANLLRAYVRVKEEMPETRLLIVGPETRLKRGYQHTVKQASLRDVVFAGYAPYEDLPRYHRTAHVFCAPATGHESQGIVLLEAMAAGKPIVASNIEGYASVLTHGVEGLLVLPSDAEGLADALLQLLRDRALRETMGERGRQRAPEFSWERISQRVLSYYERLSHEKQASTSSLAAAVSQ